MNKLTTLALAALLHAPSSVLRASEASQAAASPAGNRPNIIFLMDDQHRWDAIGRVDPVIKTPALDRLAQEGIFFDQAVCQAPMCVPSRYSMMLGLYPHQLGVLSNDGSNLADDQLPCDPLPEMLRKAGYQTAGFGKTHWAAVTSTRGFEVRYTSTDPETGAVQMSKDDPAALKRYNNETKKYGPGEENPKGYIGQTSQLPEGDHRDGWAFNHCLEFLDKGVDEKRPLFLYLSFLKPHAGNNVPAGYENLYNLSDMPVPEQPPLEMVEPSHDTGKSRQEMYRSFWSKATKEQWQQMILRYRANCSWIDSMFGRVMDKLRAKGLLDNCLIVYVSDHGEMLGERYYEFNKYCLYEHSVRVPLILSGTVIPAVTRGVVDHRLAEEVDLYVTIATAAGLPRPSGKPGENLLGSSSRKGGFCEFNDRPKVVSFMWRTSERKLILTFPKECLQKGSLQSADITAGEFYDLKTDPGEWHNLYLNVAFDKEKAMMAKALISHINSFALKKR